MNLPSSLIAHFDRYPEVAMLLEELVRQLEVILPDQLVGLYLFGSLTGLEFDRHSDIDVLAVIEEPLPAKKSTDVAEMHQRLGAMPLWCADQLELSYIPRAALRRHDPADNVHLHLDRGQGKVLEMTPHHEDWVIQRYVLRERGITVKGPDPKDIIAPVSTEAVQQAASTLLTTWLAEFVKDASRVRTIGYQSYLVLTVCRLLYTLIEGDVVSKRSAVEWAAKALDERWKPMVEAAWQDRRNPNRPVSRRAVIELQDLIRHALDIESNRFAINR